MSSPRLPILLLLVALPAALSARPLHYGAVPPSELDRCDTLQWRGEDAEAASCYRKVLDGSATAAIRAEAAWALRDAHTANRLFQTALNDTPGDAQLLTRWGDLYADTHQDAEAMNLYREALGADPDNAFAMLGAARVLVGGFNDAANEYLEPLLTKRTLADGAQLGAWLLVARVALENQDLDEAEHNLAQAETLIEQNEWPPLELLALRSAAALIGEEDGSEWTSRSLDYNPRYGDIFATPAYFYVISRRYRQAIDLYQKAVDTEPTLASAHEALGVNLLRDNQLDRARRHLELAYKHDPFSPIAVNTLRLLDSFDGFELIEDAPRPDVRGDVPLLLRLHREEAAAIAPYAIELARQSIDEFTARYGFALREPVVIEMYPDHEDFAVRTAGMPGIGILGATFGYVVAMDSPSARSTDQFQWGTTLWHEMAHVYTLEATEHLVPRWFSEGVSVYEEWRSGPTPGVRIPMSVYAAMRADQFLPVATLDQGFIRPTYPNQVIVSYMQAGLICQFVDQEFGEDKLALLLSEFRDGLDTAQAIDRVLEISAPRFDREFATFVEREHGEFLAQLDEWQLMREGLDEMHREERWDDVEIAATNLIERHPNYVEPDSPYLLLASAREAQDRRAEAIAALRQYRDRGGYDPDALKELAGWLEEAGQPQEAADTLLIVALVEPVDEALHESLGKLQLALGNGEAALRAFEILLALDPHDKASAYLHIAEAHRATGDVAKSRENVLAALDLAPSFRPAQRLLLELTRSTTN